MRRIPGFRCREVALGGSRRAGQEHPARPGGFARRAGAAAGFAHLRRLPDPPAVHRPGRAARAAAARAVALRPGRRRAARRQVRLEGRRSVSRAGGSAVADANGAVLVALDRRRQRAGAAGRRPGVAPAELDRLLEGVFLDLVPVDPRRGCRLRRRRRCGAGAADRSRRRPALAAVGGSGRRPVDRTAERATGAERRRRRRDRGQGEPDTTAACERSPSTAPRSTTSAPARRGSWPAASPRRSATCGCSATAASRCRMRCGRSVSASPPTTTSS